MVWTFHVKWIRTDIIAINCCCVVMSNLSAKLWFIITIKSLVRTWFCTVALSSCLWSSTGLLSWRIAANFLESGVGTRGGRGGVSRARSSRPSGEDAARGGVAAASASSCAARSSKASLSPRKRLTSEHSPQPARTLANDSSAVSPEPLSSSSPRRSSASSRNRTPFRWMTSSSAHSSSSSGREREAEEDCASLPQDVSVLKPESWTEGCGLAREASPPPPASFRRTRTPGSQSRRAPPAGVDGAILERRFGNVSMTRSRNSSRAPTSFWSSCTDEHLLWAQKAAFYPYGRCLRIHYFGVFKQKKQWATLSRTVQKILTNLASPNERER